jgi:hypothetical protein
MMQNICGAPGQLWRGIDFGVDKIDTSSNGLHHAPRFGAVPDGHQCRLQSL